MYTFTSVNMNVNLFYSLQFPQIKDYDNFKNNPDALVMFLNGRIKKFLKVDLQMNKQDKQPAVDLPRGPEGGQPRMPPYQGEMFFDSPKEPDVEDGEGTRRAVYQLPDTELPGTALYYMGENFQDYS